MTYTETIDRLSRKLRVGASFDLMSRPVSVGGRLATLFFVDGFTKDEVLSRMLQYLTDVTPDALGDMTSADEFATRYITYTEVDLTADFDKTVTAAKEKGVDTVTAGGGVAANGYLRSSLQAACEKNGLRLVLPERRYCTDNAAMIASEGLVQYRLGNFAEMNLTAKASIPLAATLETVQSRAAKAKEEQ